MSTEGQPRRGPAAWLRVALAATLVAWLLWSAGPSMILDVIRSADPIPLVGAFALILALAVVKAWTWHVLLGERNMREKRRLRDVLAVYTIGSLFGAVVPSTMATDGARAYLAQRRFGGVLSRHLASVVVLNAISWFVACAMGLAAVVYLTATSTLPPAGRFAAALFCAVIGALLTMHLLLKHRRGVWLSVLRRTPAPLLRLRRPLRRFSGQLRVFQRGGVRAAPVLLAAATAQLGAAGAICLIGLSVDIHLSFPFWVIYGPLVAVAALVPASVSGFGVDQAAYVFMLGTVGVPQSQAFAASALYATLVLLFNVGVGGIVYALSPSRPSAHVGKILTHR